MQTQPTYHRANESRASETLRSFSAIFPGCDGQRSSEAASKWGPLLRS